MALPHYPNHQFSSSTLDYDFHKKWEVTFYVLQMVLFSVPTVETGIQ